MRTLFEADWIEASFVHFTIEPQVVQPYVPLPLDLLDGAAVVSLVAFTQKRLRPAFGGRAAELLAAPLAHHEFLNFRTYVRSEGAPAIYFLAEWIPNYLARIIGPLLYGLPYRLGQLHHVRGAAGEIDCTVLAGQPFLLRGQIQGEPIHNAQGEFLLERYTAFTSCFGRLRRFRIAHAPWIARRLSVDKINTALIESVAPWFRQARLLGAHHSAGVCNVQISPPQRVARVDPDPGAGNVRLTYRASLARQTLCRLHPFGSADCP